MVRKHLTLLAVALSSVLASQAQTPADDPVLMRVNGNPITRSAFEYSFNKNNADGVIDKKSVNEYVPLFVNFKLKVEAAKDAGIDTIGSIRNELHSYKEQMVMQSMVDSDYIEREARKTYDNTAARFEGQDLLTASHILVLLPQNADDATASRAKARIDSIYQVLQGGADFAEVAKTCSDDKASAVRGGALGQFGKGMMIPDFEKAAYSLQPGEMSEPVQTTVGWHIIKMQDRHPFESYEFHHDNIVKFLEQRGIKEASAKAVVDSLMKRDGRTREQVVDSCYQALLARDSDAKNLAQEYYDGTLMFEVSKREVWDVASQDEAGLQNYFEKNRKKYVWDSPRFRGVVIHAKTQEVLKKAKKAIKGVPEDQWATTIVSALNTDSVKVVRVEHGIFKKGDNKFVDKKIFKGNKEPNAWKEFPEADVCGKKLKKPQTYKDVRGQVSADYQKFREDEWVAGLRQKYPVEIDESVLATVNNH